MNELTTTQPADSLIRFSLKHYTQPKMERGFYLAHVNDMGMGASRYGTPMLVMSFLLDGTAKNQYLWRVPITDEDIHKLGQVARALGLPTPSKPKLLDGSQTVVPSHYYTAGSCLVHLAPEQYQGKWRSTIAEVRPASQAVAFRAVLAPELSL